MCLYHHTIISNITNLHLFTLISQLVYIYIYDSQIVQHNPSFNLLILYNNSFDNQGSEINNNIFSKTFLSFTKTFFLLFFLLQNVNLIIYMHSTYQSFWKSSKHLTKGLIKLLLL